MSSLRVRGFGLLVSLLLRRRDWGPPDAVARRSRRLMGSPPPFQRLRSFGVRATRTQPPDPPGEWVVPPDVASPTILYLHGGGYVSCSPATHRPIIAALARGTPARVFAPRYRLAPEHPHPAALDDAERAYEWLLSIGTPPGAVAIAGDSAGGGLTLALLMRLRDKGKPMPACAVLFSPWTDLAGTGPSLQANDGKDAMFRPENISAFAVCYAPPELWRDPGVSPVYGRADGLPPLHFQAGSGELLRDDAVRVHESVQAAGGSSELVLYDGVFHVWQMLDGLVPEAGEALARASAFIKGRWKGCATLEG
jgi:monoterpene epsilon-lactone hydrolase